MKSITIKDIARMANVSCATVSRALNGEAGVRPELRERIFQICREYGYRKNLVASRLSAARSGLIGCVLSDMNNPLFSGFALELEQAAHQAGFQVMFCQGRVEDPEFPRIIELLMGQRVDGVILVSSSRELEEVLRPYSDRLPIVVQGVLSETAELPAVSLDCAAAGRQAAHYFYSLGHRRAVYLGLREENNSMAQRCESFLETAKELGMSVRVLRNTGPSTVTDVGHRLGRQFFFENQGETAVFAASDSVALGFLAAAREFYASVPEDISLIGFDNISHAALRNVRLTTFDPENKLLAERCLERLLVCLSQEGKDGGGPTLIAPAFVERNTCRRLRPEEG